MRSAVALSKRSAPTATSWALTADHDGVVDVFAAFVNGAGGSGGGSPELIPLDDEVNGEGTTVTRQDRRGDS
jgi:hypothetical protein